ncbi:M48 family metalloprotease [Nostoc linckia FACHB-104]|nr:M48 family metalloprotease [Nostoc linckia FACHB-104]
MPSHAESSLEAGLVALKQGNYPTAIAHLEPVANSQKDGKTGLQAQVGLVMAYARSGQVPKAIAVCNNLIVSPNPQVQEWAERALEHLKKHQQRKKTSSKNSANGFVAFDNSSKPDAVPVNTPSPQQTNNSVVKATNNTGTTSTFPASSIKNTNVDTMMGANYIGSLHRPQPKLFTIYWRHAGRAKVWQPLHKLNLIPLKLLATGTFFALFWVMREMLKLVMSSLNQILVKLPYLEPLPLLYRNPTVVVIAVLVIALALSPWLLDRLLTNFYGQQELPKEQLNNRSREAIRVLQRSCQQKGWPFPKLRILPMAAPIALTYGNLARNARIVISQGLLDQLADDEIAVIYATQLGHILHKDFMVMSLMLLVTMIVHRIYQSISEWGNSISSEFGRWPARVLASLTYGIWCLLTGIALWLSKLRLYYSDRAASEITGNPNALTRALLKISIGVAGDIAKQEQTSWQLESLNLVAPVSHQQSISLGSLAGQVPFTSLLMWDNFNPHRRWFTINNSHPLIGDRIQRLSKIARHWHLEPELHLINEQSLRPKKHPFFLQIAPWLGIPLGLLFAGLIWLVWQIAYGLKILNLKWIYEDWSFVAGCLLIGFSIGMVIRMNSFFPDIQPHALQTDDRLPSLLANPSAIPIDSINVCLAGKLLGRPGISNSLAQDLILQTNTGLVKLHHIPWLGQSINPQDFIGRQITVTGWFRRGATPWIDIQTMQTQNGQTVNSAHPIWSTVIAVAAQAWGAFIFLRG